MPGCLRSRLGGPIQGFTLVQCRRGVGTADGSGHLSEGGWYYGSLVCTIAWQFRVVHNLVLIAARTFSWQSRLIVPLVWEVDGDFQRSFLQRQGRSNMFLIYSCVWDLLCCLFSLFFLDLHCHATTLHTFVSHLRTPTPHNIAQRSETQKKHAKNKQTMQPPNYTTDAPITQNMCCTAPLAVTNLIYLPSLSVRLHLLSSHHTMPCICRAHCKNATNIPYAPTQPQGLFLSQPRFGKRPPKQERKWRALQIAEVKPFMF